MIDFPATPTTGQIYNSGTGPIYIWDGVAWSLVTQATRTARQNNLVVNPAMAVSQENGTTVVGGGAYPVDQWTIAYTGLTCSTQQITSNTPDLSPFRLRKTVTALKASLAAGDYSQIRQPIEGSRLWSLGYGTAAAIQSVLRFGWKGPAGTYSFSLRNTAVDRSYVKNFTITAAQANTDTIQAFAIPGDTTGAWPGDTGLGMFLTFCDGAGTTFQGVEGWNAGGFVATAANSNMVATNGNVVELFDVGLYPDPERTGLPPPFIAPIYSDALATCQRYWQKGQLSAQGYMVASASNIQIASLLPAPMRVDPTAARTTVTTSANCTDAVAALAASIVYSLITNGTGGSANANGTANFTLNARM